MVEQDDAQDLRVDAAVPPSPEEREERLARARAHKQAVADAAKRKEEREEAKAAAAQDMESACYAPTPATTGAQAKKKPNAAQTQPYSWDAVAQLQRSLVIAANPSLSSPAAPSSPINLPSDLKDSWWIRPMKVDEQGGAVVAGEVGDRSPTSIMDALGGTQTPPCSNSSQDAADREADSIRWGFDDHPEANEWPHHLDDWPHARFDASASLSPVPEDEANGEDTNLGTGSAGSDSCELPARASSTASIDNEIMSDVEVKVRQACQQLLVLLLLLFVLLLLCWWHYRAGGQEVDVQPAIRHFGWASRRSAVNLKRRLTNDAVAATILRLQGWGAHVA